MICVSKTLVELDEDILLAYIICEINRVIYNYFILNKFRSRNDMNSALTELKEQQSVLKRCHGKMLAIMLKPQVVTNRIVQMIQQRIRELAATTR